MWRNVFALGLLPILATSTFADFVGTGAGFVVPDADPSGASRSIVVNLVPDEVVTDVSITISDLTNQWVGDLIARLSGPAGTIDIMYRTGDPQGDCCGDSSDLGADYTFSDDGGDWWAAAAAAGGADIIPEGDYQPTTIFGTVTSMSGTFGGSLANGTWTLWISDNAGGGAGSLSSWTLNITSTAIPEPGLAGLSGIVLLGLAFRRQRRRK